MLSSFSTVDKAATKTKSPLWKKIFFLKKPFGGKSSLWRENFPFAGKIPFEIGAWGGIEQFTMRQLSGAVISSAAFVWFIGASGLLGIVLHYISPITGPT
jgi:hypothetical protein